MNINNNTADANKMICGKMSFNFIDFNLKENNGISATNIKLEIMVNGIKELKA